MVKDVGWKVFFSDDERCADLINGAGCGGEQVVSKEDLHDMDTQVWLLRDSKLAKKFSGLKRGNLKIRDVVRKVAFGMNFAIIGVENQENLDYSIPIKSMAYDIGTYETQASKIRREVRKDCKNLSPGEYLYGFRKDSRLYPAITFILYAGLDPWDGPTRLHEILDFTDIPQGLQHMVADYKINLIDIRRLKDTSVFHTDVRQVFDFIRCANDGKAMQELLDSDCYYENMDEEAFDVAAQYTNAEELVQMKEYYKKEGGVNMCQALKELIAEGHAEGQTDKLISLIQKKLEKGKSVEQIADEVEESVETVEKLIREKINVR